MFESPPSPGAASTLLANGLSDLLLIAWRKSGIELLRVLCLDGLRIDLASSFRGWTLSRGSARRRTHINSASKGTSFERGCYTQNSNLQKARSKWLIPLK